MKRSMIQKIHDHVVSFWDLTPCPEHAFHPRHCLSMHSGSSAEQSSSWQQPVAEVGKRVGQAANDTRLVGPNFPALLHRERALGRVTYRTEQEPLRVCRRMRRLWASRERHFLLGGTSQHYFFPVGAPATVKSSQRASGAQQRRSASLGLWSASSL